MIDKVLVVGGNWGYTTELYSRKQFLNLCEVTESSKNGVYYLTLALNKKYNYTPELYVCEATKDSITIYRTIACGEKTQYKITLLDNDEFTMEKHWCNLSVQKSGNIFSCIYTNEIIEEHSDNYSGTMNFNKGKAHISLVSAANKEMQRYDLGITKGKINKIVRSSDFVNSGTMSVVSTFEISSDGKKATLDYSSLSVFLDEIKFYSNGIVKERIRYNSLDSNGAINKDYYVSYKYNKKGQLVEMISNEKDEKEKMVGTYKGNTVDFTLYQGIDDDAEEYGHLVQDFDDYGRITESIYSTKVGGILDMSKYTFSDDWSYARIE